MGGMDGPGRRAPSGRRGVGRTAGSGLGRRTKRERHDDKYNQYNQYNQRIYYAPGCTLALVDSAGGHAGYSDPRAGSPS